MVNPGYSSNLSPSFPEFWDGRLILLGEIRYRESFFDAITGVYKVKIRFRYSKEFKRFYGHLLFGEDLNDGFTEIVVPATDIININEDPIYNRVQYLKTYDGSDTPVSAISSRYRAQIIQQEETIKDLKTQLAILTASARKMSLNPMQFLLDQKELLDKMGVGKSTIITDRPSDIGDLPITNDGGVDMR